MQKLRLRVRTFAFQRFWNLKGQGCAPWTQMAFQPIAFEKKKKCRVAAQLWHFSSPTFSWEAVQTTTCDLGAVRRLRVLGGVGASTQRRRRKRENGSSVCKRLVQWSAVWRLQCSPPRSAHYDLRRNTWAVDEKVEHVCACVLLGFSAGYWPVSSRVCHISAVCSF